MDLAKSVRLLVIDEQAQYFELIKEFAEISSHQVLIECQYAASGAEAKKKISSFLPSVILVDVHTPDPHGFNIIEAANAVAAPVIVTSKYRCQEIADRAMAHGASAYVPKAEHPDELESLLYRITQLSAELAEIH